MAAASIVLKVNPFINGASAGVDNTQRRQIVYGTATITAGDGTSPATGIAISWAAMSDANGGMFQPQTTQTAPSFVELGDATATAAITGNQSYRYNPNIPAILVAQAGSKVATGIIADVVPFKAEWVRGA